MMKYKSFAFLTFFIATLLLQSACHKCVECTETASSGEKEIEYPEVCGKKSQIDDYRKYMENNVNPSNKVKCTERKTTLF
jgi:hypothetical protein